MLALDEGKESSTILSVGYRPTRLAFAADEARVFAVTEPGVSVVALDGIEPSVVALVEVSDDPLENPASRDVTITPDGKYALVRRDDSPAVSLVTLDGGEKKDITLSGNVTDLDLSEDGLRAVAVIRDKSEVAVLPIPGGGDRSQPDRREADRGRILRQRRAVHGRQRGAALHQRRPERSPDRSSGSGKVRTTSPIAPWRSRRR